MGISIIIPVYNVEPYITDCLQSVMRQTYQGSLECIIVDDCGTDKSIEIAERLIADYEGPIEFRIVHHEHNRGLSAARNTGKDAATGDYVYFLDSDDFIDEDTITILWNGLKDTDYVMAIGYACAYRQGVDEVFRKDWLFETPKELHYSQFLSKMLMQKSIFTAWGKLFEKDLIDKVNFREGRINEDTLFMMDLAPIIEENKLNSIELPLYSYHYRMRDESICHQSVYRLDIAYVENIALAIERYKDRYELVSWLKKDQIRRALGAVRNRDIDKKSFFTVSKYIRVADNKIIREVTSKKGYVRMLLVKYSPHLMWVLGHKLKVI